MIWNLRELVQHCETVSTEINNRWVPCRPDNWKCWSFWERLRDAWAVLVGRAEAFRWPEG